MGLNAKEVAVKNYNLLKQFAVRVGFEPTKSS